MQTESPSIHSSTTDGSHRIAASLSSSDNNDLHRTDFRTAILAAGLLVFTGTANASNPYNSELERFAIEPTSSNSLHADGTQKSSKFFYVHGATHLTEISKTFVTDEENDDAVLWRKLASDLDRWSYLQNGWDGNHALAPSAVAIHSAMRFRAMLMSHAAKVPELYIDGDGEVGFRWRRGSKVAVVAFPFEGGVESYIDDRSANLLTESQADDVGFFLLDEYLASIFEG